MASASFSLACSVSAGIVKKLLKVARSKKKRHKKTIMIVQCSSFNQRTPFLTSIGNRQNYTISRLLEDYYLCTNMGKLITEACWIILLLYLLLCNANTQLKQQSRAIIWEKQTPVIQKRTIRKLSKLGLYYNNSSATHRLILSGDIETNPGPANHDNQQTKPKSDRLASSTCELCNKTVRINSKKLTCIHCKSLVHLQCSTLKAIPIIKKFS